jgi:ABC-type transport system substrate-binding protein
MVGRLDRRTLLGGAAATVATASLTSACTFFATDPKRPSQSGRGKPGDRQAPELAVQTETGKLPPLADRLPEDPMVIKPVERLGTYGGEWHSFIMNVGGGDVYENIGYDNLVRWAPDWTGVIPNVARSWEIGRDGRDYTFALRKGMKWSDGESFTADDIMFAYQDVLLNEELFPITPDWVSINGQPAVFHKIDDYQIRFSFVEPNGLFLQRLATASANILTSLPKHHLQRFHPKYNPDASEIAEDNDFSGWSEALLAMGGAGLLEIGAWQTKGYPTLLAWQVAEPLSGNGRFVAARNPYYWKVDPEGKQLPYLDRVVLEVVTDPQVGVLRSSQGQYCLPPPEVMTSQNKPILARARESGDYHFSAGSAAPSPPCSGRAR